MSEGAPGTTGSAEAERETRGGAGRHPDVERVLISAQEIQERVRQLGRKIDERYAGQDLLMIAVLKGSVLFIADLMRAVTIPHEIDFLATSSYGASTTSTGVVRIMKDLNEPIEGRHALLIEDIVDSGHTLSYLTRWFRARNPASLEVATLLDKPSRREVEIDVFWTGFSVPDEFVIGYGLDYMEKYRNLPYIGVLKPAVHQAAESPHRKDA